MSTVVNIWAAQRRRSRTWSASPKVLLKKEQCHQNIHIRTTKTAYQKAVYPVNLYGWECRRKSNGNANKLGEAVMLLMSYFGQRRKQVSQLAYSAPIDPPYHLLCHLSIFGLCWLVNKVWVQFRLKYAAFSCSLWLMLRRWFVVFYPCLVRSFCCTLKILRTFSNNYTAD